MGFPSFCGILGVSVSRGFLRFFDFLNVFVCYSEILEVFYGVLVLKGILSILLGFVIWVGIQLWDGGFSLIF